MVDIVIDTLPGNLSMVLIEGLSPRAATVFFFVMLFLSLFKYTNIHTGRWLGYRVKLSESHTLHHGTSLHRFNSTDLPIFEILFGTFRNHQDHEIETGL